MSISQQEARSIIRKAVKRVSEGEEINYLNIMPMMDMMTILLIFFLKDFSVSTQNITMGEDMMLPSSTARAKVEKAVEVTVTKRAILVENEIVAAVKKGEVDSSLKRDGQSSFLINPLLDMLQKHATRLKKLEKRGFSKFEGEMLLVADQTTPYRLISEVLYTAGQAEFGKYRLIVLKGSAD